MSFVLIGNLILNLMCVVKVRYSAGATPARLSITMLAGDPLVYTGEEAELVWSKFKKMGTPLESV